jgi:phage terminase large subunit
MSDQQNPFYTFHEYYGPRPVEFVRDQLHAEPDPKQIEVLEAYASGERRIATRSGHGVGKTTVLAWIIIHAMLTKFPFKGVATAPTEDQLYDALAAEVKAWISVLDPALKDQLIVKGEVIELRTSPDKSFFSFRTARAEKPEAIAGIHSENVLVIIDEASGVPEQIFVAGLGSMSSDNAQTLMAGNPTRDSGYFFEAFHKNATRWKTLHISCVGHPRVTQDFIDDIRNTYGEESNEFRVRVLGEFPRAGDKSIIARALIEASVGREIAPPPETTPIIWAVDPARFGDDRTAIAKRQGYMLVEPVQTFTKLDTMQVAALVHSMYKGAPNSMKPAEILVDVIGLGAGVVDRLMQLGVPVRGINVSESSLSPLYGNLRSELWYKVRDWFAERKAVLPDDPELVSELAAVQMDFSPSGKLMVESKAAMKRRGMRSPDKADAFVLTFATDHATLVTGTEVGNVTWTQPFKRRLKSVI